MAIFVHLFGRNFNFTLQNRLMASGKKIKKQAKQEQAKNKEQKGANLQKQGFFRPANYPWFVAIVGALLYIGTLGHGYVYDDEIVIQKNIHVQDGFSGISDIWSNNYLHGVEGYNDGLYRPLSPTMFAVGIELFGPSTTMGHFMNILMYSLVCLFVFLFIRALTGGNDLLALVGGLLFAAHPIHTEVVANIKSRDEIMAGLFGFAALYYTVKEEKLTYTNLGLIGLLFLLSLFSKESAIAFALVIPLVYWFKHREMNVPLIQLGVLMGVIAIPWYLWHEHIVKSMENPVDTGLFSELSNATLMMDAKIDQMATGLLITMHYVYKSIIPYPLINDYSPNAIVGIKFASSTGLFCFLVLTGIFLFGLYLFYKKRNIGGLGILIFFLLLAPVANVFMPIGTTMGERMAFAPSLGVVLGLVALYNYFQFKHKKYVLSGLLAVFVLITVTRAAQWKSNLKLYEVDVQTQPNSFRTHYNYATALNKSVGEKTGEQLTPFDRKRLELSIEHFTTALEMKPDYADGILNLGNAHRRLGNTQQARELYADLMRKKPEYTKAVFNMAVTYYEEKNYELAHKFFIQYLDINGPQKGMAWYSAGVCSGYLTHFEDAIKELNNSLAIDNTKWDAWNYLGMAYGNSKQWDKAVSAFQMAYNLSKAEDVARNLQQAKKALSEQQSSQ